MKKSCAVVAVLGLGVLLVAAVPDWLNYGGDPQRSGWQRRERYITRDSLSQFKLLWKLKLDNESRGPNSLTAPVIFGPIITHRGMKELVFIAGASDNVYALDADLGRIFWKRHIESAPDARPCGNVLTAAPVLAPQIAPDDAYEDATPPRPLYVLSSDGSLHTLRTTNGQDIGTPVKILPPNARASNLNFAGQSVYTTTSGNCGGAPDGVWAMNVTVPDAKPRFSHAANIGVTVGFDGAVYSASSDGKAWSLTPDALERRAFFVPSGETIASAPVPFQWKGRELVAASTQSGRLMLFEAQSHSWSMSAPLGPANGLATWPDANGMRWIYVALPHSIGAFKVTDRDGQPVLEAAWTSQDLAAPVAPVVVNGMVFALSSDPAILYALDAATGKELYSSGKAVTSPVNSSGLALANGHVCFGTADNTLYCFGIPTDI
jgi:outer membrane protein assembly factor BamB